MSSKIYIDFYLYHYQVKKIFFLRTLIRITREDLNSSNKNTGEITQDFNGQSY